MPPSLRQLDIIRRRVVGALVSVLAFVVVSTHTPSSLAQNGPVIRFAGYGFISDFGGATTRFPILCKILGESCSDALTPNDELNKRLVNLIGSGQISGGSGSPPYRIVTTDGDSRSADARVMALAFTNEHAEEQSVAGIQRTTYSLWSQLLVFDFQTSTLLASYPLRLQFSEQGSPSDKSREIAYREMLFGDSHKATFAKVLPDALRNMQISRSTQWIEIVSPIHLEEAAVRSIHRQTNTRSASGNNLNEIRENLGQLLQAELAEKLKLTVLPFIPSTVSEGTGGRRTADSHTLSRMRFKFTNTPGQTEIVLPEPTFQVVTKINDLRTVRETQGNDTMLGVGAFATFAVQTPSAPGGQPLPVLADTRFRNVAIIRLREGTRVDEWASHRENLFVLVARFVQQIGKPDGEWLSANSAPPGAEDRIRALRTRLKITD